jgi:hypothetical protein
MPPDAWLSAPEKRLSVFGMSGLGKTRLASLMRDQGEWFHYSIDYRIGTAYMGEHITDNLKRQAMQVPFLADLLRSDSIYIGSNITFGNLAPLSTFLGKPGDTAKGGLPFEEYMRRQDLHRRAEINALLDTPSFISRARDLYGYPNVVAIPAGRSARWWTPTTPRTGAAHAFGPYADGLDRGHRGAYRGADPPLRCRAEADVLPAGFPAARLWRSYLDDTGVAPDAVDPDAFVRFAYARALAHRAPLYAAMARNWGITVTAEEVESVRDAADVLAWWPRPWQTPPGRLGRRPEPNDPPHAHPPALHPARLRRAARRGRHGHGPETRPTGRTSAPCGSGS